MKCIVFDSSTLISIATNNLLWVLEELKKKYGGEFYITPAVKDEIIDYPLLTKKFKLEAVQILSLIFQGVLKVYESPTLKKDAQQIVSLANHMVLSGGKPITLLQEGEIEALALALELDADLLAVDERTTRVIIEDPEKLASLMGKKTQRHISLNEDLVAQLLEKIHGLKVARSVELLLIAFDLGILERYVSNIKNFPNNLQMELIEGLLWGLRFKGCSISEKEINEILDLYKGKLQ